MFQLPDLDFLLWIWKTEHHSISRGKALPQQTMGIHGLKETRTRWASGFFLTSEKTLLLGLSEILSLLVEPMTPANVNTKFSSWWFQPI